MARKTQRDAEKTRRRILASALSLFARKGYDRTTFNDIAARLGLTKGAVYWHFDSKQALLVALVDDMVDLFGRQIAALKAQDGRAQDDDAGLTFPAVADLMVRDADMVVSSPKMTAFFLLMKGQVRWSDTSMAAVRENLLRNERFGPWEAFRTAVENDVRAGRVRAEVDPVEVASVCIALWDGLVHTHISRFLPCSLTDTLRKSYDAVWQAMKV